MTNQIVLVGRIKKFEKAYNTVNVLISVTRNYKNQNGEYEADLINVELYTGVAENTMNYCQENDLIGIKGRLETKEGKLKIIAEKVTFLANCKKEGEE